MAFSPDGKRLASIDSGGTLILWDALTGNKLHSLPSQTGPVGCVTFSGDGRYLAWAGHRSAARMAMIARTTRSSIKLKARFTNRVLERDVTIVFIGFLPFVSQRPGLITGWT